MRMEGHPPRACQADHLNGTPSNFRQVTQSLTILFVASRPQYPVTFSQSCQCVPDSTTQLALWCTSFITRFTKSLLDDSKTGFLLVVGRCALFNLPLHLMMPSSSRYKTKCLILGKGDNWDFFVKKLISSLNYLLELSLSSTTRLQFDLGCAQLLNGSVGIVW